MDETEEVEVRRDRQRHEQEIFSRGERRARRWTRLEQPPGGEPAQRVPDRRRHA